MGGIRRSESGGYYPTKSKRTRTRTQRKRTPEAEAPPLLDPTTPTPAQEALIQREGTYPTGVGEEAAREAMDATAPAVAEFLATDSAAPAVADMGVIDEDCATTRDARVWSEQQEAIFSWFARKGLRYAAPGMRNLVVRARAGTGKTTTILEAISRAPERRILLAAFNKRIASELQERLHNPNAEAATLHSVGYRIVRQYWSGLTVDDERAKRLTEAVCERAGRGFIPVPIQRLVTRLHTKIREVDPHADDAKSARELAFLFDCVPDDEWRLSGFGLDWVCERALEAVRLAASQRSSTIDFADMIFLPLRNRWMQPRYDLVVIDEAQDMSAAQLEMALGVLQPGGRIAVVGDDRQAVYGFRGADSTSLDRLKKELGAYELGLTMTYRCGKAIVAEARRIVPDIEAAPANGAGIVRTASTDEMMDGVEADDFILSRTNAPLVRTAMTLLRRGRRVRIEGRDIGSNLKTIVRKLSQGNSTMSMTEWGRRLTEWERRETEKAEDAEIISRAEQVRDQAETLRALSDDAGSPREVEARIDTLFSDNGYNQIICSSVHRAKGLEANRVWALRETFYPQVACRCGHRHQYGAQTCSRCKCTEYRPVPSKQQEERNIGYVAITRARKELIWVK